MSAYNIDIARKKAILNRENRDGVGFMNDNNPKKWNNKWAIIGFAAVALVIAIALVASRAFADPVEKIEEQIEQEKKRAINEVKNEVSGLAIDIAAAVIGRDVSAGEHEDLINDFIDNMGAER